MGISRIVGDKLVVLASESFQVFTRLPYLLLVSVETNDPGLILRQLAEIRHLARGRAVEVDNDLVGLRIQDLAGDHSGKRLQMDQSSLVPTVTHTFQSIVLASCEIVQAEIVSWTHTAKRCDYIIESAVVDRCKGLA